jgi:hypothetical protein
MPLADHHISYFVVTLIAVDEIAVFKNALLHVFVPEIGLLFCPGSSLLQETSTYINEYKASDISKATHNAF